MPKTFDEPFFDKKDIDLDDACAQSAIDQDYYFAILEEQEIKEMAKNKKVSPIGVEFKPPQHTDKELVPESLADVMFSKICFDPEAALKSAAHESWLLDDLLPAKGIAFIYGPPGSYKSFIALDMAAAITSGAGWHGYECEMQGACLYIAAEGSRGLMERIVAWEKHYNRSRGPLAVMTIPVMMDDVVAVRAFTECLEKASEALNQPIRLVVIDTMARSFSGDENSAQEVGAFVNACTRFSVDIGDCLVMVVAHTGKDLSRGMRGSSALDGAADCHFLVTKPNLGQALVKNTKQKDIEMAEPMRFAMEPVSTGILDRKGRIRRSLVPILESKGEQADPDAEDDMTAFDHKDANILLGLVKAADRANEKITEDELRIKFIDCMQNSQNKKPEAAKKTWQRAYKRARDNGTLMKAGAHIYLGEGK